MNKGTVLTGFLHFRPPDKASGLLSEPIVDKTDSVLEFTFVRKELVLP